MHGGVSRGDLGNFINFYHVSPHFPCQSGRQLGGLNFDYYDPSESWANLRGCVEDKEC